MVKHSCKYPECTNTYVNDEPGKYCSVQCQDEHYLYRRMYPQVAKVDRKLELARKEVDDFFANSESTIATLVEAMCESLNGQVQHDDLDEEVVYMFRFSTK